MAKGSQLKEEITQKILDTFPGSFRYDKELRIPGLESGEQLQIKVTLTCAKTNVKNEDGEIPMSSSMEYADESSVSVSTTTGSTPVAPTDEEKARVSELVKRLGLA